MVIFNVMRSINLRFAYVLTYLMMLGCDIMAGERSIANWCAVASQRSRDCYTQTRCSGFHSFTYAPLGRLHDEAGSTSWLDERSSSQLVEPASSCKRGITVTSCG